MAAFAEQKAGKTPKLLKGRLKNTNRRLQLAEPTLRSLRDEILVPGGIGARSGRHAGSMNQEERPIAYPSEEVGDAEIQQMLSEMQSMARAKIARLEVHDSTHALQECVDYLKLTHSVELATGSMAYVEKMHALPNRDATPLLTQLADAEGTLHGAHMLLMSLSESLDSLKAELEVKKARVLASSGTVIPHEQLDNMSNAELGQLIFKRVAEQKIIDEQLNLETLTEELQSNRTQQKAMRGRSIKENLKKERARISKAIAESVAEYNKYIPYGSDLIERRAITLDEMLAEPAPEFPWWGEEAELSAREDGFSRYPKLTYYGAFDGIRLCKAHALVARLKEEQLQLVKEGAQYVMHYKRQAWKCREQLERWDRQGTLQTQFMHTGDTLGPRFVDQALLQTAFLSPLAHDGVRSLIMEAQDHFISMYRNALEVLTESFFTNPEYPSPVDWETLSMELQGIIELPPAMAPDVAEDGVDHGSADGSSGGNADNGDDTSSFTYSSSNSLDDDLD
eukprot:scaffold45999_cov37-Prasinocladus_malaysianus.AAC.3